MVIIEEVSVNWIGHAGFKIKALGLIIYIDPYIISEEEKEIADYIIITHEHYDHCNLALIKKLSGNLTQVIAPPSCISKIESEINIIAPEEKKNFELFTLESVPSYNLEKRFHPRDAGNGYILSINGVKIYHAGDTDLIPEMNNLRKEEIDLALLPVGGTYTMDIREAVKALQVIQPKKVFPMHYGTLEGTSADIEQFKQLIKNYELAVEVVTE